MGSAVERTDEHVREYLIFRGFNSTLKHFDSDIKADKEKGFRKGNLEKTQEFFQKQALELQTQSEWRDWFILPFIPSPEQNPAFSMYFSRQWADTFLVSLHNFLSVLFQCMPQPVLLSFEAEVQKMTSLTEENERLRQRLFALHTESRDQRDSDEMVHHKFPPYIQNKDRLGDTELDLMSSQRAMAIATAPSKNFFSTFLPPGRRTPGKPPQVTTGSSSSQTGVIRQDPQIIQPSKSKEAIQAKEGKPSSSQSSVNEPVSSQSQQSTNHSTNHVTNQNPRHKRIQDHEKERKELLSKPSPQTLEKKGETEEVEPLTETSSELSDCLNRGSWGVGAEGGGLQVEQPFIKLSQEEYGEHHSSIMHCRVDCSGRRVASLDVDGVIKVWSFNPIMQTKATIMSKSPLLSLEWATKPDRLLLLGSGVGTVRLYDTDAKKNLYEMNIDDTHPRILSLACSPSGSSFVCSAAAVGRAGSFESSRLPVPVSGQLLLWDTKTVKQQLQFSLEPGPVAINCTAFNHNGNLLVTGAADGIIRLFDMQRYESAMSWRAHDGEVYSVEFSSDENTVFSIGEDGKFIQWNIHRCGVKQTEQVLPQDATGPFVLSGYSGYKQVQVPRGRLFAFNSEGQHILTCSGAGGIIYRLTNGEPALERVLSLGGHKAPVVTVDWCSAVDCGTCLTASMDGKIKLSTLLAQKS
ncbi:WD repeat-containing protein 91 isoform X2 [Mugil cephalus]|uniref:WD repeat-containing protein 91 isoform X2 n=1 Tax=Mugil cephalus TaxID=48193 RepID=UPI001FB77E10|nr:WD repeat-containing protein 91 isoform X2 [Mugil cephalus]